MLLYLSRYRAGVAQLVEQLICNQQVGGSSPSTSSTDILILYRIFGGFPEWPKGTDCKSAGNAFGGSNPPSPTKKPSHESVEVFYLLPFTFSLLPCLREGFLVK